VMGTSKTVPISEAAKVSQGRYCWSVWPLVEDRNSPGQVSSRQPFVNPVQFCYTSGPAKPAVRCEPHPADTGFSSSPIHCEITLPYAADGQWEAAVEGVGDEHDLQPVQDCTLEPTGLYFRDLYDCHWKFDILPRENRSYKVTARVYNSDAFPVPVKDASSLVWEVSDTFETRSCGGDGDPCCAGQKCDTADLACSPNTNTCIACGGPGQLCCTAPGQPACRGDNAACTRNGPIDQCCAARLESPVLIHPPGVMNLWNGMLSSQSACWRQFGGGSGVPDACRNEIDTALRNGTVPVTRQFQVGWTQVLGAAQYEARVTSFTAAGIETTTYPATIGLTLGFPQPVSEAPGVKWVMVEAVDACLLKRSTSAPGIFIFDPPTP
jgi:hypothetical protein